MKPNSFTQLSSGPWLRVLLTACVVALTWYLPGASTQAAGLALAVSDDADVLEISWTSDSITTNAPFIHYEFQVETSLDLNSWTNFGGVTPGGALAVRTVPQAIQIPKGSGKGFYRLAYRLNMPGSNLGGLDFSGTDLRSANLSGAILTNANFSGADLSGADLTAAIVTGANLTGAALGDVNLDGLDLSGLDLSQILGTPVLTQVTADPAGSAAELIPHLVYNPDPADLSVNDAAVPGLAVSVRNAMVMLKTNASVGQLNGLLSKYGASIIASTPSDVFLKNGLVMLRFRTTNALQLFELTKQLTNEALVEVAAPDILLGIGSITDDRHGASDWLWGPFSSPGGGNWGLEKSRVPQMWNLNDALNKTGPPALVSTCVLDGNFTFDHQDLILSRVNNPVLNLETDHGMHVAGIIGATHGNDIGIDGVNPFASLIAYEHVIRLGGPIKTVPPIIGNGGYQLVEEVRNLLHGIPQARIINISLNFNWSVNRAWAGSPSADELVSVEFIARAFGATFANVAGLAPSKLFVCIAGNDSNLISARLSSPMANAAFDFGVPNIVVVQSHGITGAPSPFSNSGGHVSAPGEDILSTSFGPNSYATYSGTSMAAPYVSGLAGYLLAVDPNLTPVELITLLRKNQPNVDAFTSVMEIDNLPGRDREVLKMLLDIDDGGRDGNERVRVPAPALNNDRSFQKVEGPDFEDEDIDGDGGPGDGVIDMSDFRRWRDWLLFGEGNHALNGTPEHVKHDANQNGQVETVAPLDETTYYPRGDFNGDGIMDRTARWQVPGWFENLSFTDLGVINGSELWADPNYTNALELVDLIDSVDFAVSATNLFFKEATLPPAQVTVRDATTDLPISHGATISFTESEPEHIFTVPVGGKYFISSEPIDIGGGTNVLMRSIGEHEGGLVIDVTADKRGADFAVDLCLVEMTAIAELQNPSSRQMDSRPDAVEVQATLNQTITNGYANEEATLYAAVIAGGFIPTNSAAQSILTGGVRWQRTFIKHAEEKDPTFEIKPMVLRLGGTGPSGAELNAFAEIVLEMRAYDISPAWQPVFLYHAEIAGAAVPDGNPSTFHIVGQEGDLPDKELTTNGSFGAEYVQEKFKGTNSLAGVEDGHSFELRYRLLARVIGNPGDDGEAFAYVGDPLHYGSGIRMEYGAFGELPRITDFTLDNQGAAHISYRSRTNFYYFLYRGTNVDTTGMPIAMKLGTAGSGELIDPTPPVGASLDSYTLENQPIAQPLDVDADGINDVYELLHPAILIPLDGSDAAEDPDADGFSNLAEFINGTNPEISDGPTAPLLRFPGIIVPTYAGGELIDLNNDGVFDSAWTGTRWISAALGHVGGVFQGTTNTDVPGARSLSDAAFFKLDGDTFLDALAVDLSTNRLSVLRGLGDGRFEPLTSYPTMGDTRQIALGDLNGDGIKDVAAMSGSGRGADLYLGVGDGTLTQLAPVSTNAFGFANAVALGDFNGDLRDDVVVTYSDEAVVFLSQATGGYHPGQPYSVGAGPESIVVGDLNHDGHPDILVANRSRDDLSVLLGVAGGTFLPEVRYPVGELPLGLRLADLNGDSFLDVVVSQVSADYQTVFLNPGNGTLGTPYAVPTGGGGLAGIIDWNGDGKLDLVSGIPAGGLVNLGNGNGTFATRLQIVTSNSPPTQVQPIDLNGDNRLELIGLNIQSNSIDVWEHASVTGTNRLLSSFGVGPYVVAFNHGDFNGDGQVDVAVATGTNSFVPQGSNQVVILFNQGNATFQDAGHIPLDFKPDKVVSGDFNGDGHLDLAVLTLGGTLNGGTRIVSLLGDGSGGFQIGTPVLVGNSVSFAGGADVDGDLRSELVLQGIRLSGNVITRFIEVFAFDATAGWTTRQALSSSNNPVSVQIHNMNGDSFPDVVSLESDAFTGSRTLVLYPGGVSGLGTRQVLAENVGFQSISSIADLNNDGNPDVVSFNTLFLAKQGGGFHPSQAIWNGLGGVEHVADFNRDGKQDLLRGLSVLLQE